MENVVIIGSGMRRSDGGKSMRPRANLKPVVLEGHEPGDNFR